jgi:hypothetical protein
VLGIDPLKFEAENDIKELSEDEMYRYDKIKDQAFRDQAPWTTE